MAAAGGRLPDHPCAHPDNDPNGPFATLAELGDACIVLVGALVEGHESHRNDLGARPRPLAVESMPSGKQAALIIVQVTGAAPAAANRANVRAA